MRQSNLYIIFYAIAITVVCGGLLAFASQGLKVRQDANIALEQKQNIIATVITVQEGEDVEAIYNARINAYVIDNQGNVVEGAKPEDVNVAAEYKKPAGQRLLPIYEFTNESDSSKVDYVILPIYGYGLWNNIWGFVALQSDFNTIQGAKFEHAGETPGLGARITTDEIQNRYKGKEVFNQGALVSVAMQKGEGNDYAGDPHKVDGMSGATLTGKGVNSMLDDYLASYKSYLEKNRQQ